MVRGLGMDREFAKSDATFYLIMAVVPAVLLFLGFAPSFYLRGHIPAPVPPLTQLSTVHGVVYTAWIVLFIAQAALIRFDGFAVHRQLGMLLAILFGAMFALGCSTAITAGRLGHIPPGAPEPLRFMALPLIGLVSTLVFIAAALLYRRRADVHKRLMLTVMFTMTGPGTGRLTFPIGHPDWQTNVSFIGVLVLVSICMGYDQIVHKRIHPVWWVAQAVNLITWGAVLWAYQSPQWLAFAHGLTGV